MRKKSELNEDEQKKASDENLLLEYINKNLLSKQLGDAKGRAKYLLTNKIYKLDSQALEAMISKEVSPSAKESPKQPKVQESTEPEEVTDMELIQVARKSGIDLVNEAHLLLVVEDVLYNAKNPSKFKLKKEKWSFRYKDDGTCYWINTKTFVTRKQCPFIKEVKMRVEALRKTLMLTAMEKGTVDHTKRNRRRTKKMSNMKLKSKLLLDPHEIHGAFKSNKGKELYDKMKMTSEEIALSLIKERLEQYHNELNESEEEERTTVRRCKHHTSLIANTKDVELLFP